MLRTREDVTALFVNVVSFYDIEDEMVLAELNLVEKNFYHNDYHTKCVVVQCAMGASELGLPFDDTRDLLIAARFHDYAHSGGKTSDAENVNRAVRHVKSMDRRFTPAQIRKFVRFIRATQFPFAEEVVPYPIEVQILRDADIMQSLMPDWKTMYHGLQLEVSMQRGQCISEMEWWDMTNTFYAEASLFTTWAGNRIDEHTGGMYIKTMPNEVHLGWRDANWMLKFMADQARNEA